MDDLPQRSARSTEPRTGRRRRVARAALWVGILVGLLMPLLVAFVWFVFLPSRQGSATALVIVNGYLRAHTNLRLAAAVVRPHGSGLVLLEPRVLLQHEHGSDTLLAAREIRLEMDWLSLLLDRPQRYVVDATQARLALTKGDDGRVRLPEWRPGPARAVADTVLGPGGRLSVRLRDASFEVRGQEQTVVWWKEGRLGLEARWLGGTTVWDLSEGAGYLPPLDLHLRQGRARATSASGVVEVQPIEIETDVGSIEARAALRGQVLSGEFTAREWPWEFFAELLDQPALDVPGRVQVRGLVEGPLGEPRTDLVIQGMWRAEPFTARLTGELREAVLRLDRAELEWAGTRVAGSGHYGPRGRWALDAQVVNLDLSAIRRLAPAVVLPPSRLAGPVYLAGEPGRIRVLHERLDGNLGGVDVSGLRGEWTLAGKRATWNLAGGVSGGAVRVEGEWDGRRIRSVADFEDLAWAGLAEAHPAFAAFEGGAATGQAWIEGPPDSLSLRMISETRGLSWNEVTADVVRLDGEGRVGARSTRLDLVARAEAITGAGVRLDSAHVTARVRNREIEFTRADAWRGDTTLTALGRLTLEEPGWSLTLASARVQAGSSELVATEPIVLRGSEGSFEVLGGRLEGTLGELTAAGVWRPAGGTDLRIEARRFDPRLLFPANRLAPVSGATDMNLVLTGSSGQLSLQVRATADTLWVGSFALEEFQLGVVAHEAGQRVLFDEVAIASRSGTLTGKGELDLAGPEGRRAPWREAADPGRWQGSVEWTGVQLEVLRPLFATPPELGGISSGTLRLAGPAGDREAATSGRIEGFRWNTVHLDAVRWDAEADHGRLVLRELVGTSEDKEARIEGELPVRLAWSREAREWIPDEPMRLVISLPGESLHFLPLFLPPIATAEGKLTANLRLEGTPRSPVLWGNLEVDEGVIRASQREETYRNVKLRVRFEGDRALIESFDASQGEKGRLRGSGHVRIFGDEAGDYRLELDADRAIARSSGEYSLQFSGHVTIEDGPRVEGVFLPLPYLTGDLTVESGVILYDFTDPENVIYLTGPREPPLYVYDLHLKSDGRVYWRTPSVNIELKSDLFVSRDLAGTKLWGSVESLGGHFYFLENRFEMDHGNLTFDRPESFDALLNAEAVTTVTRALEQSKYEKEEVRLALTGRMLEPEVRLWSSSGLSEKEIFALLTFGRFGLGSRELIGQSDQRVLVGVTGTQYLMRQLAREIPEVSALLSSVELGTTTPTGTASGAERLYTTVGVRSYVTPELRLGYSQVLGSQGQVAQGELMLWDFSAEYRVGRLFYLTGQVIERRVGSSLGSGTFQNQVEYNLDLRARIDY